MLLQADLHVSSRPQINLPHQDNREWLWSGSSNTLVHNDKFALLVDTSITVSQNEELTSWIKSVLGPDRSLTHVFITHGHKDHYLGIAKLLDTFPALQIVATAGTIKQKAIHDEATGELWLALFPDGQIDTRDNWTIQALPSDGKFNIEGTEFRAVSVEQGDCANASFLYVPDLELVCAGDIVIATHLYLREASTPESRKKWFQALETIESFNPQIVVPGHMRAGQVPGAKAMIQDTKAYLQIWEEELGRSRNSEEMFSNMKARFPRRFGDFVLQMGADEAFPSDST